MRRQPRRTAGSRGSEPSVHVDGGRSGARSAATAWTLRLPGPAARHRRHRRVPRPPARPACSPPSPWWCPPSAARSPACWPTGSAGYARWSSPPSLHGLHRAVRLRTELRDPAGLPALQGLGFGGEWAAGAILVAEYARPATAAGRWRSSRARGRSAGASRWSSTRSCSPSATRTCLADPVLDRRVARAADPVHPAQRNERRRPPNAGSGHRGSFKAIFRGDRSTTLFAALLATGVQGGYYTLATWLPTYLKTERKLTVVGTGGYLAFLISGAFLGYLTAGTSPTGSAGRRRSRCSRSCPPG